MASSDSTSPSYRYKAAAAYSVVLRKGITDTRDILFLTTLTKINRSMIQACEHNLGTAFLSSSRW